MHKLFSLFSYLGYELIYRLRCGVRPGLVFLLQLDLKVVWSLIWTCIPIPNQLEVGLLARFFKES